MKKIIDGAFIAMLEGHDLYINKPLNGLFGGNRKSKKYGSSAEFADYREYQRGDDLRRIDWNLYARFEKLFLKLYTDERQLHHRIYIDCSASMDWGEPEKSYFALRLAAAIGYLAVQAMDRVSFYELHGSECRPVARTVIGREAFYSAADELNRLKFYGESDISAALTGCDPDMIGGNDGMSFIISDFFTDSDWSEGADRMIFAGRELALIQVVASDEVSPLSSGRLMLLDSEGMGEDDPRTFRTEITKTRMNAYVKALEYHRNTIRSFAASRGASFVSVCSDEKIEKILYGKMTEAELIK